jgi:hypothetical protein
MAVPLPFVAAGVPIIGLKYRVITGSAQVMVGCVCGHPVPLLLSTVGTVACPGCRRVLMLRGATLAYQPDGRLDVTVIVGEATAPAPGA